MGPVFQGLDGLGRTILTETGDANGTKSQAETVYDSCGCSPIGKMIKTALAHAPAGTPVYTTYTYDGIGRTLSAARVGRETRVRPSTSTRAILSSPPIRRATGRNSPWMRSAT